jgi:hypothetical protein
MTHTPTSDPLVQHVSELIAINNERFKSYARAMLKTHDSNFKSLCAQTKERSVHFNMQLIRFLAQYNDLPEDFHFGVPQSVLPKSRGVDRKTCYRWDTIALKAYRQVIRDLQHIPKEIRRVLLQQQEILESDRRYSGIAL